VTIYIVRHGQTEWNRDGRQQGVLDSPLTPLGIAQARAAGETLRGLIGSLDAVRIEASPIGRAWNTARIVAETLGLDPGVVIEEPLLAEHDLGEWGGLTYPEIDARFPGARKTRAADKWDYVIPGGESYALIDVRARAWLAKPHPAPVMIAVTHEMLSRTLQGAVGGLSQQDTLLCNHPHDRVFQLAGGRVEEIACGVAQSP
jgi:probable phosphoglycerate mutase